MSTDQSAQGVSTEEARQKIEKAWRVVTSLCDGTQDWTMNVPARPDSDPDLVIGYALRCAGDLVAERDALASRVRELEGERSIGFSPMYLAPIDGTPVLLYMPTTGDGFAVGQWHGNNCSLDGQWGDDEGNYYVHEPVGWMGLHVLKALAALTTTSGDSHE